MVGAYTRTLEGGIEREKGVYLVAYDHIGFRNKCH